MTTDLKISLTFRLNLNFMLLEIEAAVQDQHFKSQMCELATVSINQLIFAKRQFEIVVTAKLFQSFYSKYFFV